MGHDGIYATKAQCDAKVGELVDVTGWTEANINDWCHQSESLINVVAGRVFAVDATAFTALPATTKQLLAEISSNIVAIYGNSYNPAGFTSRVEFEDRVNILRDAVMRGLGIIRSKKNSDFLAAGA